MRPKDDTLAKLPEEFAFTRSTARTVVFSVIAAAALIACVLCIVNFEAIRDDAADMTGRRSGLRGLVAPAAVLITGFFAVLFALLAVFESHVWRRVATHAALSRREFTVNADAEVAGQWHNAFASGDPANYLPVPNHKKGQTKIRVYVSKDDRLAFVTVQHGTGAEARTWPLITLRDRAYAQLKNLQAADFSRPARAGVQGAVDPFLRG